MGAIYNFLTEKCENGRKKGSEPAALRGPKSSTPCQGDVPKIVPWSSACQCPPFPAQEGGKVIFRNLSEKVVFRVGRVRSYLSNRQDSVLL